MGRMVKRADTQLAEPPQLRGNCLCLHLQRAARVVARRFDEVFRPFDLTNGQFSLLMALKYLEAPNMSYVASLLAMDRTTLTAALKPLERRGLVKVTTDRADKRSRCLLLTSSGLKLLQSAIPVWRRTHAEVERLLPSADPDHLRADLRALS
jgi:DNA-binding MarR family transcriptional regulator